MIVMIPFTLLIKPSGSDCNLNCKYCFYIDRASDIGHGCQRMSYDVLDKLIKDYLELKFPFPDFAWQGGEPTLMGLDFYRKAIELQHKYRDSGQDVSNSIQTNAILLDEEWCRFLSENKFLVGISIDGPGHLHDYYRLDLGGNGTFERVMKAIEFCKEYKVEFNTLTLINNVTADCPDEIFDFLIELGIRYMQFISCVEINPRTGQVTDFSVSPKQYGNFLCRIFDRWIKFGPQNLSIRDFDSILNYCLSGRHTICTFNRQCNNYIVVEHTGDVFPCDFFVDLKWRVGNIIEKPIEQLAADAAKMDLMQNKGKLCNKCFACRHLAVCWGGCLKERIPLDPNKFNCESYFCESYRMFFDYSMPRFIKLAEQFRSGALVRPSQLI
jgi:uncharacterized protein